MSPFNELQVGKMVTIRRSSGAPQRAMVRWVLPNFDAFFTPPEAVVFGVEFMEDGKLKIKNCRLRNLLDF